MIANLNKYIDHTILKPFATAEDVRSFVQMPQNTTLPAYVSILAMSLLPARSLREQT